MTETQRAAMKAAHDAIAIAQNNLAPSRKSAIAFDDGDLWDQYQHAMDGITAALIEPTQAPLLTADEKLQIALSCNMRVRTGSGAIKYATAIEQAVRKKAWL